MPLTLQNLFVLLLVAACVAYLLFGLVKTLSGRKSSLGNCCAKGCSPVTPADKPASSVTHFIPVESLSRRK